MRGVYKLNCMNIYKYKHKETGLFLHRRKSGGTSLYSLRDKGTIWTKQCLNTLSLNKTYYDKEPFKPEEFEIVKIEIPD